MLKKPLFVSGILLIATMMVAVYLFGVHHGYKGKVVRILANEWGN